MPKTGIVDYYNKNIEKVKLVFRISYTPLIIDKDKIEKENDITIYEYWKDKGKEFEDIFFSRLGMGIRILALLDILRLGLYSKLTGKDLKNKLISDFTDILKNVRIDQTNKFWVLSMDLPYKNYYDISKFAFFIHHLKNINSNEKYVALNDKLHQTFSGVFKRFVSMLKVEKFASEINAHSSKGNTTNNFFEKFKEFISNIISAIYSKKSLSLGDKFLVMFAFYLILLELYVFKKLGIDHNKIVLSVSQQLFLLKTRLSLLASLLPLADTSDFFAKFFVWHFDILSPLASKSFVSGNDIINVWNWIRKNVSDPIKALLDNVLQNQDTFSVQTLTHEIYSIFHGHVAGGDRVGGVGDTVFEFLGKDNWGIGYFVADKIATRMAKLENRLEKGIKSDTKDKIADEITQIAQDIVNWYLLVLSFIEGNVSTQKISEDAIKFYEQQARSRGLPTNDHYNESKATINKDYQDHVIPLVFLPKYSEKTNTKYNVIDLYHNKEGNSIISALENIVSFKTFRSSDSLLKLIEDVSNTKDPTLVFEKLKRYIQGFAGEAISIFVSTIFTSYVSMNMMKRVKQGQKGAEALADAVYEFFKILSYSCEVINYNTEVVKSQIVSKPFDVIWGVPLARAIPLALNNKKVDISMLFKEKSIIEKTNRDDMNLTASGEDVMLGYDKIQDIFGRIVNVVKSKNNSMMIDAFKLAYVITKDVFKQNLPNESAVRNRIGKLLKKNLGWAYNINITASMLNRKNLAYIFEQFIKNSKRIKRVVESSDGFVFLFKGGGKWWFDRKGYLTISESNILDRMSELNASYDNKTSSTKKTNQPNPFDNIPPLHYKFRIETQDEKLLSGKIEIDPDKAQIINKELSELTINDFVKFFKNIFVSSKLLKFFNVLKDDEIISIFSTILEDITDYYYYIVNENLNEYVPREKVLEFVKQKVRYLFAVLFELYVKDRKLKKKLIDALVFLGVFKSQSMVQSLIAGIEKGVEEEVETNTSDVSEFASFSNEANQPSTETQPSEGTGTQQENLGLGGQTGLGGQQGTATQIGTTTPTTQQKGTKESLLSLSKLVNNPKIYKLTQKLVSPTMDKMLFRYVLRNIENL